MTDDSRINSTAMTIEDHATRACNLMGVAGLVRTDMWTSLVMVSRDCSSPTVFKDTMRAYEEKWCKENITDGSLKKTRGGKPIVGPHLENTYKQYKSRIISAWSKGISLTLTDGSVKPPSQVQKELSAATKKGPSIPAPPTGIPVIIPVTFTVGGKDYELSIPAEVDISKSILKVPTFEGKFNEK